MAVLAAIAAKPNADAAARLSMPAGWLPGQLAPVLVEWLGPTGRPDREVWDAEAGDRTAKRLVTTAVEHHAVLHMCESLARANRVNQ